MNRLFSWVRASGLTGLLAVAIAFPPAIAQEKAAPSKFSQSPGRVAQTTGDLCRQVAERQGLAVRRRPTPNSPRVGGVPYRGEVTLVRNFEEIRGPGGRSWVEITYPVRGFISVGYPGAGGNLADCSEDLVSQPPRQPASLCRRIDRRAAPRGVAVRARPSRSSARVGGVPTGAEVYLVEDYQLIRDPNDEPRDWVEIAEPVAGFISAGTLIMCR